MIQVLDQNRNVGAKIRVTLKRREKKDGSKLDMMLNILVAIFLVFYWLLFIACYIMGISKVVPGYESPQNEMYPSDTVAKREFGNIYVLSFILIFSILIVATGFFCMDRFKMSHGKPEMKKQVRVLCVLKKVKNIGDRIAKGVTEKKKKIDGIGDQEKAEFLKSFP